MGTGRPRGAGRKAIRIANGAVDTAILLAILLLLAIGCYALWDAGQVNAEASAERYRAYRPAEEDGGLSFAELQAINPEVVAWLTVYGTHIDYPVAQSPDNMKYVNTDAEGGYSLTGSIFLDSGCSSDFSDFSSILYGHHMEKEALFGEIGLFADRDYFEARRYGRLYFGGRGHGLEFFAFLKADAYDRAVFRTGVEGEAERGAYLSLLLSMATHTRDIGVTAGDRIVLLSTCASGPTNGRDILVGRIADEAFADPFAQGGGGPTGWPAVDGALGAWDRLPLWAKAIILAALAMALAWAVRRKKKKAAEARGRA